MNRSKYGRPETTRVLWRRTSATRIAYGSRVRRNARSLRCASYQGRRRSARPVPIPRANAALLQNRSGAAAEEHEVELRERDPDDSREFPPPCLDLAVP